MAGKNTIKKEEWKTAAIIALAATLLSILPLITGYATEGPEEHFMGVAVHVTDANNHLHLAQQAKEGALLFTNRFTAEDVPALLFNPYHLVIGWTAWLLGAKVVAVYNAYQIIFSFVFLLVLYHFIAEYVKDRKTRTVAMLLAAFSSGLGLWWALSKQLTGKWLPPIDLWLTDMNTFLSLDQGHFTLSMTLLLLIFLKAKKAFEQKDTKSAAVAGALGLLLSTIHLFDVVTMAAVLTVWFAVRRFNDGKWDWQEFKQLAVIGAITAPGVLYYAGVFLLNPAYAAWNSLNQTTTPPLYSILSGIGLIAILAVIAIWKRGLEKKSPYLFMTIWTITTMVLIYLPFNVQRRFLLGVHIPLSILAASALTTDIAPLVKKQWRTALVATLIILAAATTIYVTMLHVTQLHEMTGDDYSNVKYLTTSEYDALIWLDANTDDNDVVLAPLALSNHIPAVSGNKVYVGHWAQTIDYEQKKAQADFFYTGLMSSIVPADYVIATDTSLMPGYLEEAHTNGEITILRNTQR